jgi:hypothetical protein
VRIVNGGNTNGCWVSSAVGVGVADVGQSFEWPVSDGTNFFFGSGPVTNGTVLAEVGHDYCVIGSSDGITTLLDQSGEQTAFFWWGFSFSFCAGLVAVFGAKTARKIVGDFNE